MSQKISKTTPSLTYKAFEKLYRLNMNPQKLTTEEKPFIAAAIEKHWEMLAPFLKTGSKTKYPKVSVDPIKSDKGKTTGCLISILSQDRAFLIDSITAFLIEQKIGIKTLYHPRFDVKERGKLSFIHIRVNRILPAAERKRLEKNISDIIGDILLATEDWPKMRERVIDVQKSLSFIPKSKSDENPKEVREFMEYIHNNNFTFLGYREYHYNVKAKGGLKKGSGLGVLSNDDTYIYINKENMPLPDHLRDLRKKLPILHISKINQKSTVHRRVFLDAITVKLFNKEGKAYGEALFVGLFTSITYTRSLKSIPYLRAKAESVFKNAGFKKETHEYRALNHIIEKYPRDELFQIDTKTLTQFCLDIIGLQEKQRVALFMREDPFKRYMSCLVYVPRDRYDTRLRYKFEKILEEALCGYVGSYQVNLDDSSLARALFIVQLDDFKSCPLQPVELEQSLREAAQNWPEKLAESFLEKTQDASIAFDISKRYGEAFNLDYFENNIMDDIVGDIMRLEQTLSTQRMALNLYKKPDEKDILRLRLVHPENPIPLFKVFPLLQNMGYQILEEITYEVTPKDSETLLWLHELKLSPLHHFIGMNKDFNTLKILFEDGFHAIWDNKTQNDELNTLISGALLSYRKIALIRCFTYYLQQIKVPYSFDFIKRTLIAHPKLLAHFVDLFILLHDPSDDCEPSEALKLEKTILRYFRDIASYDEDKVLNILFQVLKAVKRTNFYQKNTAGGFKTHISIKIDSQGLSDILPKPTPYREIFIFGPMVRGIHLRGGKIARGGLRWSDREEDFRTEVLGLMKAQMVKNAIIIPEGAKGGFVPQFPTHMTDRQEKADFAKEAYIVFIKSLLDITDNRINGKIKKPHHVVCLDGDDPYLVVAADKGTATFSDTANALSEKHGFWLGDAFASGGSAGYDHKVMGITARGAWESVKHHFAKLGRNCQTEPFTAIGVGDMGGDVFGNGMLLSKQTRLLAAFNHLHIFCDPNPNAEASFKERKRLFKKSLGWNHYNPKLLSQGGMVFERSQKSLSLTPEIRERFQIEDKSVSPHELIKAILRSEADLFWLGGIGTYIKSKDETHAEVGDKANDLLRIDAHELKVKMIGEGANLGVTQKGRIAFAQSGGLINTDFIDNSAGVDSSDHEVNIKILFQQLMAQSKSPLSIDKRNDILKDMTDAVAQSVLHHNKNQVLALSMMQKNEVTDFADYLSYIQLLENNNILSRKVDDLPDEEEVARRRLQGRGLTRPELAIMLSSSKIELTAHVKQTKLHEHDFCKRLVLHYFPQQLQKKYETDIYQHALYREIAATSLANVIVDRLGPVFVYKIRKYTGAKYTGIFETIIYYFSMYKIDDIYIDLEKVTNLNDRISRLLDIQVKMTEDCLFSLLFANTLKQNEIRLQDLKANHPLSSIIYLVTKTKKTEKKVIKSLSDIDKLFHFEWLQNSLDKLYSEDDTANQAITMLSQKIRFHHVKLAQQYLKTPADQNRSKNNQNLMTYIHSAKDMDRLTLADLVIIDQMLEI